MTGHLELREGLDLELARVFGVPAVRRALDMLQDSAQAKAPPVKTWITMRDERVRPSHVNADGQAVPTNLRFRLDSKGGIGHDLADHPRDPNLPIEQRINCRCADPVLERPLRDSIHKTDVTLRGTIASGSVETGFPRAAESEFGGDGDEGAYFFTQALQEVALRLRSGHAR